MQCLNWQLLRVLRDINIPTVLSRITSSCRIFAYCVYAWWTCIYNRKCFSCPCPSTRQFFHLLKFRSSDFNPLVRQLIISICSPRVSTLLYFSTSSVASKNCLWGHVVPISPPPFASPATECKGPLHNHGVILIFPIFRLIV